MRQIILGMLVAPLTLLCATAALAVDASVPNAMSAATGAGQVDSINLKSKSVIVGDRPLELSSSLMVRDAAGRFLGHANLLKPGQLIAYKIASNPKVPVKPFLTEAWMLPPGFIIPEEWK